MKDTLVSQYVLLAEAIQAFAPPLLSLTYPMRRMIQGVSTPAYSTKLPEMHTQSTFSRSSRVGYCRLSTAV